MSPAILDLLISEVILRERETERDKKKDDISDTN
jgi:hypothetical protein